ncbi:GNAT family N-acetyltransferase [Elioraea sp.]|uniref:GNAT family N-acetyltransferase n=1 Tax=Elioraea sp. TaxID=2185103 RepID=UPI0025C34883|nr:GNAT family N-acetyltransferase [Elioraea sp.]
MAVDILFEVRPPAAGESEALAAILAAMERHYDTAVTDDEAAAATARLLGGHAPARCLVALAAGPSPRPRFIGITLFAPLFPGTRFRDVMYLKDLFVLPEARGAGVARTLVAGVAQAAIDAGCERLEWVTDRGNALARAAYRALGATEGDRITYRIGAQGLARLAATGHAEARRPRPARCKPEE